MTVARVVASRDVVVLGSTTSRKRKTLSKETVGAVAGFVTALQAASRISVVAPPVPTIPVWSITKFVEDVMVVFVVTRLV